MSKVSIITLGCKLNKYESDCMARILEENGYCVSSKLEFADIYILNTCGVTAESEKKSRQYIAKFSRLNPNAKIIVCGCASQNNISQFADKRNVYSVFGNEDKKNILKFINNSYKHISDFSNNYNSISCPKITTTRAYMKVQDGCNNFCSYCLIPYLRGRSRSRAIDDCVKEAYSLSKVAKEIVLTGIDLSSFSPSLGELMLALKDVPSRIRIGSLEVGIITDQFLKILSSLTNFCPQFHLSLQSGDNEVLRRMNRHYTREEYRDKVGLIRKYFPDANITTDIIVGFASETDGEFLNTLDFVKEINFGHVHVFPYSVRTGTAASKLYKDLPMSIKKERVDRLEEVARISEEKYIASQIGKTHEVLTEDMEGDNVVGYTANYLKVALPKDTPLNCLVKVKLLSHKDSLIYGKILEVL